MNYRDILFAGLAAAACTANAPQQATAPDELRAVQMALAPLLGQLSGENKERGLLVEKMLKDGLPIKVIHDQADALTKAKAVVNTNKQSTETPEIHLSVDWDSKNVLDLSFALHELLHVAEWTAHKTTMDDATWKKFYQHPQGHNEIRAELSAWEFHLNVLSVLSKGELDSFVTNVKQAPREDAPNLLNQWAVTLQTGLHAPPADLPLLKRQMELYFLYQHQMELTGCPWSYAFVMDLAGAYEKQGINQYEVTLEQKNQQYDSHKCVSPLPKEPDAYKGFYEYKLAEDGRATINPKPILFQ